jgi:pimeloyl-ACP methyl ester carboxylesterase
MPKTQYAKSGDLHIAYQVTGKGPLDLVLVPGFVSHLEYHWEYPGSARFLERLGSFSRLICFDKRGTGLSDRVRAGDGSVSAHRRSRPCVHARSKRSSFITLIQAATKSWTNLACASALP